jgi:hypothetical protein
LEEAPFESYSPSVATIVTTVLEAGIFSGFRPRVRLLSECGDRDGRSRHRPFSPLYTPTSLTQGRKWLCPRLEHSSSTRVAGSVSRHPVAVEQAMQLGPAQPRKAGRVAAGTPRRHLLERRPPELARTFAAARPGRERLARPLAGLTCVAARTPLPTDGRPRHAVVPQPLGSAGRIEVAD